MLLPHITYHSKPADGEGSKLIRCFSQWTSRDRASAVCQETLGVFDADRHKLTHRSHRLKPPAGPHFAQEHLVLLEGLFYGAAVRRVGLYVLEQQKLSYRLSHCKFLPLGCSVRYSTSQSIA